MILLDFQNIGRRIKTARKQKKLTQAQLSAAVGIGEKYLSNIETGADRCSLSVLVSIANELHVSVDYLLGENLQINRQDTPDDLTLEMLIGDIRSMNSASRRFLAEQIDLLRRHGLMDK